jgi:hypothetical protein
MEAQWFSVAEQGFAQYSFAKKLWCLRCNRHIRKGLHGALDLFT